jgi:hypothetical protein
MANEWKTIGLILILMSIGTVSHGTSQRPDKIIYQGKNYDLHSNPLEKYFERNPDKRPKGGRSSNLWRGYIATFEIIDNDLFVVDIQTLRRKDRESESNWTSVLKEVFPDQEKVKLDWFDGLLVIPYGEMTKFVYMGYGSLYEHYILLEIGQGNLNKEKRLEGADYEIFKDRQFEEFKKTNDYRRIKETLKNEMKGDSTSIDSFLKISIIEFSSKILTDK